MEGFTVEAQRTQRRARRLLSVCLSPRPLCPCGDCLHRARPHGANMTEIRELNEGDLAAWTRVSAQAYRRGDLGDGTPRWPEGEFTRLGLFEREELVAQFHL